ncbi:carbohydrate-binding protein [Pontiella agarivorans]|uniref:Carbohydrate-binding protein n=1 Tax=Pontiella agarivorans TaxID=3038953 RepID=A0ABU5MS29_9BACT|nr:carbohydrate-binding protein [Pontiella agarivorans]MDZ8117008.1 carbohydrate-binding protein [Pontiella agarivorans]
MLKMMMKAGFRILLAAWVAIPAAAKEFHVSKRGDDRSAGSLQEPLLTIAAAAAKAQPGDTVIVHEGVYRERINPPRGGVSDAQRITYQAFSGDNVVIKGSEVISDWTQVEDDVWKAVIPNSFFGDYNPFADVLSGDWYVDDNWDHHQGAVYLNGDWLHEARSLDDVMQPVGAVADRYSPTCVRHFFGRKVTDFLRLKEIALSNGVSIDVFDFIGASGVDQVVDKKEKSTFLGNFHPGDWVLYDSVDLTGVDQIELLATTERHGAIVEVRLGGPRGRLIGSARLPSVRFWSQWFTLPVSLENVSGTHDVCMVCRDPQESAWADIRLWYAKVDETKTTIWAQFPGKDPNRELVEVNARRTVFYPDKPGRNYITVRGFTLEHAATPWAPPTAEQVGLIGTHWSKGWVIEDNTIRYATCTGVTLGKFGDEGDNQAESAPGYVETIKRALSKGWNKESVGSHLVRNNHISHCEQAGIVGSMGAAFSRIEGNHIHDIHVKRQFWGAEMAAIKFHGPIDTQIIGNYIHHSEKGIWLDWMTQGTRVSGNLLHDNPTCDLHLEVNHGPFLFDNNIFLSEVSLWDWSNGGAYVHNLFAGTIQHRSITRNVPYHPPHKTDIVALKANPGGDSRFYNNIFAGRRGTDLPYGLSVYAAARLPMFVKGNVYYNGAQPFPGEQCSHVVSAFDPEMRVAQKGGTAVFNFRLDDAFGSVETQPVDTEMLGKALIPNQGFEHPDGSPITIDQDILGEARNRKHPAAGPFSISRPGKHSVRMN